MFILGDMFVEKSYPSDEMLMKMKLSPEEYQKMMNPLIADIRELFHNLTHDSYYILLPEANHMMFGECSVLLGNHHPSLRSNLNPARCIEIIRSLLLAFFNHYLRGEKPNFIDYIRNHVMPEINVETNLTK